MILVFTLSMPNVASWNGKWSGAGNLYAIVKNMGSGKKAKAKADELLKAHSWYHNFGDGWGASVTVNTAIPAEARRIRKESRGFCGYDWMVENILSHGSIKEKQVCEPISK